MTRAPMMAGDTYADAVVWRWQRKGSRWSARLKDGVELRAQFERLGGSPSKRGQWRAVVIDGAYRTLPDVYTHPDLAQKAALDDYKKGRAMKTVWNSAMQRFEDEVSGKPVHKPAAEHPWRSHKFGKQAKPPTFPPALADVEAELGPAREWAGRCYEIAVACVDRGFVEGVAVYGHWIGEIHPRSMFAKRGAVGFVQHGWVQVRGNPNVIFDPTRWAFTMEDPYLYFGPNKGEYDEGGNTLRKALRPPCPKFDPESRLHVLTQRLLAGAAWTHVEKMLGPNYLIEIGKHEPGTVTAAQLFWLANAPYDDLEPHAKAIYGAIEKLGEMAAIPIDNYRRAQRG